MMHPPPRDGTTPLDPDEADELKLPFVHTRSQLNASEQANLQQGLMWLSGLNSIRWDDAFVRQLHLKLFGEVWGWAGQYRSSEKNIGLAPESISSAVRLLMDELNYWCNNGIFEPLEAACRFHHRLVAIHPFVNGNGRHARIATDFMLERLFGHPSIPWLRAQDEDDQGRARRSDYLQALRAADKGEYAALYEFMRG